MSTFEFDVSQLTGDRILAGTIAKIRKPQPLYKAWANYLEAEAVRAFKNQRAPGAAGKPWAELSDRYRRYKEGYSSRKKRKGTNARGAPKAGGKLKLQWSGALFNSLYARATNNAAEVGTAQKVGRYDLGAIHNFGAPRANVPARPFLPVDADGNLYPGVRDELNQLLADYLNS